MNKNRVEQRLGVRVGYIRSKQTKKRKNNSNKQLTNTKQKKQGTRKYRIKQSNHYEYTLCK